VAYRWLVRMAMAIISISVANNWPIAIGVSAANGEMTAS